MEGGKGSITFLKQTFQLQGGLEKYCLLLAEECIKLGFSVTLLTLSPKPNYLFHWSWIQLSISFSKLSFLKMLFFDIAVRNYVRKKRTLLFGFDRHFLSLNLYRAGNGCHRAFLERRMKEASLLKKILFFLNPLHICTLWSEKKTFESKETEIICNSELVRSEIVRFYPKVALKRVHVIHNGVDWHELEKPFQEAILEKERLRREGGIPYDALHIVLIGNEWHRKGVDIFLRALSLLKKRLKAFSIYVTIAGKERNPKKFQGLVRAYEIEHTVSFIPKPVSTVTLFQTADICVIPSRYDPFANITVEALAMGLWVCSSRENGGSEVIESGVNGSIARECTAELFSKSLASSITHFFNGDISKEAIRKSSEKLDIRNSFREYAALMTHIADF